MNDVRAFLAVFATGIALASCTANSGSPTESFPDSGSDMTPRTESTTSNPGSTPWSALAESAVPAPGAFGSSGSSSEFPFVSARGNDCVIKGNVNAKGEKIYHVPGAKYYEKTHIDESAGEKWFCSEEEARAAGWRKSKL